MRVVLVSNDTRGGIQPYVALGVGLLRAGHDVRVVAPENYAAFISSHGLQFSGLPGDVQGFMDGPEYAAVAKKGFLAAQLLMLRKASELIRHWMAACLSACDGADLIVAGIGGQPIAEAVAERLRTRFVQAHLQPLTPTGAFPGPLTPGWLSLLGSSGNRLSHILTRQMMWQPMRPAINAARRSVLGLPSAPFWGRIGTVGRDVLLYGFSRHVLPRPSDWRSGIHVTGYWFLDADSSWEPPAELVEFLDAGPPPIVVGFGSMKSRDAEGMAAVVVDAVRQTGQRAVLLSGWGGLRAAELPSSVIALESVPHDCLLPRASLMVHHGGAGTTGAVFRAGVPSVVVPFGADQPFWGRVVAGSGCGPAPIPQRRLDARRLAGAIVEALREPVRRRAAEVGERVRAEGGVREAVRLLTR